MSSVTPLQQATLWGQLFEIAVKRGVLAELQRHKLIECTHPSLIDWKGITVSKLYQAVRHELAATDDNYIAQIKLAVEHMLELGYGLGLTCIREYLKRIQIRTKNRFALQALWCPLSMPNLRRNRYDESKAILTKFKQAFNLPDIVGRENTIRGYPAWSDFTLLLTTQTSHPDNLLVLEFSYHAPSKLPNFALEEDHRHEIVRFERMVDARGFFSQVCAEVKGEQFVLSPALASHLKVFASRDKPFFKLCQGASYVDTTVELLKNHNLITKNCKARVIAVTSHGFESLTAQYSKTEPTTDPRVALMVQLGSAYRKSNQIDNANHDEYLIEEIAMVFRRLSNALPKPLRKQVRALENFPKPDSNIDFNFSESIEGFCNPMKKFGLEDAYAQINDSQKITDYFGCPGSAAIGPILKEFSDIEGKISLRGLHSAAIVAALRAMKRGKFNVLALEGNPGIGKTTAVRRYLTGFKDEGYIFIYVSPRIVINKDVIEQFIKDDQTNDFTGILTITTNATLIRAASQGYQELIVTTGGERRKIDSAVLVAGVDNLIRPACSIWFLTPEQEKYLENLMDARHFWKESLSERQDLIREHKNPGIIRTLASSTRYLLTANFSINRIVLTAAVQGYREVSKGSNLINAFSQLFENKVESVAGFAERRRFAERIPNVIVMVDEVAGDGAGVLFVHKIAEWLDRELLIPFENQPAGSPFKVGLIIADASLGNEVIFENYLATQQRAPDKVLVSRSAGSRAFSLAATEILIGAQKPLVLHIMTNSYPAKTLKIDYRIRMTNLQSEIKRDGNLKNLQEQIRSQGRKSGLLRAYEEIYRAIRSGSRQVIYFAQDKTFLRNLGYALQISGDFKLSNEDSIQLPDNEGILLTRYDIAFLDGSVTPRLRKRLLEPKRRDKTRVFLMTSSGARGISFPLADWIIVAMPRFNIEAQLMEVAQLIYRGRGSYPDPDDSSKLLSGDNFDRQLVMVIDDFINGEELTIDRRLWLRRASDLLTLVMMLRATIFTRITGDAGMSSKNLALVPVGQIGATELLSTMNQSLKNFLTEGYIYLYGNSANPLNNLIKKSIGNVEQAFSAFQLNNLFSSPNLATMSCPKDADNLHYAITHELSPLIPQPIGDLAIPQHIYCLGPFWIEDWSNFEKLEQFTFEKFSNAIELAQHELSSQLYSISKNEKYPPQIRVPARELYRILIREARFAKCEFSTIKPLNSKATFLVFPLDYPRFWSKINPEDGARIVIEEGRVWKNALSRALQNKGEVLPVIPCYDEFPYIASLGVVDPVRIEQIFDDRYFAASTELNLLNTLLLAEDEIN